MRALTASVTREQWPLREPFAIARGVMTAIDLLVVTVRDAQGHQGWAEAAGVDYDGETIDGLLRQVTTVLPAIQAVAPDGLVTADTLAVLQSVLPPGGARNALDCALWDLRAKQSGIPAWQTAGLPSLEPLTTVYTIGIGTEADTRRKASAARGYPVIKIKCNATQPLDMVRWVRDEHPTARLSVDANQSWSRDLLESLLPALQSLGVELVEQPVRRGDDATLAGLESPIPLAADESCVDRHSMAALAPYYQVMSIKLDKCGGLTEALAMAEAAAAGGLGLMVGNMCGTSLGMAPATLIGQRCQMVDLDGPLLQVGDRAHPLVYRNGLVSPPTSDLWG